LAIKGAIFALGNEIIGIYRPHQIGVKNGNISGFETALGSLMSLVHSGQLELNLLIAKLTSEPAKIIGDRLGKLSSLRVGATADVTIFDPNLEWTVDAKKFISKGKNTPLDGARLKGRVIATIYQGKIVYKNNSVKLGAKA
jgi:dihydroorotase